MKKILLVLTVTFYFFPAMATDLPTFLKGCAYGTLGGALAGVVSLALTDKPSEHGNNIARGASLGLYAGIAYGLLKKDPPPAASIIDTTQAETIPETFAALQPMFHEGQIEGAQLLLQVGTF